LKVLATVMLVLRGCCYGAERIAAVIEVRLIEIMILG
jgi:hypothetical protein